MILQYSLPEHICPSGQTDIRFPELSCIFFAHQKIKILRIPLQDIFFLFRSAAVFFRQQNPWYVQQRINPWSLCRSRKLSVYFYSFVLINAFALSKNLKPPQSFFRIRQNKKKVSQQKPLRTAVFLSCLFSYHQALLPALIFPGSALTFRQSLSCLFKRSPVRNPKRIPIREICPISDFQPKYLF